MLDLLKSLRKKIVIGFVGGSDLSKIVEQLGPTGTDLENFYIQSTNRRAQHCKTGTSDLRRMALQRTD